MGLIAWSRAKAGVLRTLAADLRQLRPCARIRGWRGEQGQGAGLPDRPAA